MPAIAPATISDAICGKGDAVAAIAHHRKDAPGCRAAGRSIGKPVPVVPNEPVQANSGCGSSLRQQRLRALRDCAAALSASSASRRFSSVELLVLAAADHAAVRSRAHDRDRDRPLPRSAAAHLRRSARLRPGGDRPGRDDPNGRWPAPWPAAHSRSPAPDGRQTITGPALGADGDLLAGFAEIGGLGRRRRDGRRARIAEREQPGCQLARIERQVAAAEQRARPVDAELRGKCAGRQIGRVEPRLAALLRPRASAPSAASTLPAR